MSTQIIIMHHYQTPEQNKSAHIAQNAKDAQSATETMATTEEKNIWEPEIRKFERDDERALPPQNAVLFVGSSSFALWSDLAADFAGIETIRRGFGGSMMSDALYFFDRIVSKYQPRAIVVYFAGNDLSSGKTPRQIADEFAQFIVNTRQKIGDIPIFLLSGKLEWARMEYRESVLQLNAQLQGLAEREANVYYIDVMSALLNPDGHPNRSLYESDGIHINRRGYELWTQIIKPKLNKIAPQK